MRDTLKKESFLEYFSTSSLLQEQPGNQISDKTGQITTKSYTWQKKKAIPAEKLCILIVLVLIIGYIADLSVLLIVALLAVSLLVFSQNTFVKNLLPWKTKKLPPLKKKETYQFDQILSAEQSVASN